MDTSLKKIFKAVIYSKLKSLLSYSRNIYFSYDYGGHATYKSYFVVFSGITNRLAIRMNLQFPSLYSTLYSHNSVTGTLITRLRNDNNLAGDTEASVITFLSVLAPVLPLRSTLITTLDTERFAVYLS